jgi:hypothetical protein
MLTENPYSRQGVSTLFSRFCGLDNGVNLLSAVLIGFNIHPWNRTESNLTLFHNPYAQQKIESSLSELNEVIPENDGSIKFKQGTPSHKILDLEPLTL